MGTKSSFSKIFTIFVGVNLLRYEKVPFTYPCIN